jgi:large conductance mechanosensitive channel protein
MLKGFKEFILRGNVVDLAVAVVIGTAFGAVVAAFVADVITPLIGRSCSRSITALSSTVCSSTP